MEAITSLPTLSEVHREAKSNNVDAQFGLAMHYLNKGQTVTAVKWFKEAAQQKDLEAIYWLAYHKKTGTLIDKDEKGAVKYYKQGAELGDMESQYGYGCILFNGEYVEKNEQEGTNWIRKAAKQGHQEAIAQLKNL